MLVLALWDKFWSVNIGYTNKMLLIDCFCNDDTFETKPKPLFQQKRNITTFMKEDLLQDCWIICFKWYTFLLLLHSPFHITVHN